MNTMTHEMQVAFPGRAHRFCPGKDGPEVCPYRLRLYNVVRQFVPSSRPLREMRGECFAGFFNRFDECTAEFFILEMRAHGIDKSLPELPAAFFMNGLVAYHGKLMRSGRDENEHGIALARFVHPESVKFFLRSNQWISTQLAALNINPDLTGGFRFRFPNRPNDSIVFEPTEKFLGSHLATS
jgi:hypothetical protein